jgi:hypothetical protein
MATIDGQDLRALDLPTPARLAALLLTEDNAGRRSKSSK